MENELYARNKGSPQPLEQRYGVYATDIQAFRAVVLRDQQFESMLDLFSYDGTPLTYEQCIRRLAASTHQVGGWNWKKIGKHLLVASLAAGVLYGMYHGGKNMYATALTQYEEHKKNRDNDAILGLLLEAGEIKRADEKHVQKELEDPGKRQAYITTLRTRYVSGDESYIGQKEFGIYLPTITKKERDELAKMRKTGMTCHYDSNSKKTCSFSTEYKTKWASYVNRFLDTL